MEFVKKSLMKWIEAALILVVGILVIVAGAQMGDTSVDALINGGNGSAETLASISLVLGWSFIVIGSLGILGSLLGSIFSKAGFAAAAIGAGVTLAIGIWLAVRQQAGNLMFVLIGFVPFVMIVVGSVLAVDAGFICFKGIKEKAVKKALPAVIFGAIIAIASIVLGALCIATKEGGDTVIASNAQLIIFGVILVIYALFLVLATFVSIPLVTAIVVKESKPASDQNDENKA